MPRSHRVVGILVLAVASLLVSVSPAAAASATGKNFTLPAVTKTTYSISGRVRASATSAEVAGVEVYASSTSISGSFASGAAITSASGYYTISHLLPGPYSVFFDPPRATNLQRGFRNTTGPTYFGVSRVVAGTITTASLTGENIWLPAGYKISGKVTRSNGTTAIANVEVNAGSTNGGDSTTTDSAGNYTLMGLSPGSYEVSFGHDPASDNQTGCWYTGVASKFAASCALHTNVVITSANVTGISPKIWNSLKITGYVKTRASTPVPIANALVLADGPVLEMADTDATGKYTITGLNPGSYSIRVGQFSGSPVTPGYYNVTAPYYWAETTASASSVTVSTPVTTLATIEPATGYFIKGKITNTSGTALDYVGVQAVGGASTATADPGTSTDASGNYAIGPLPPGVTYKIDAYPFYSSDPSLQAGWYLKSPPNDFTISASSALAIHVTSGDVVGINMRLPKGASISGTVKITGGSACSGCSVEAVPLTGSEVAFTNTSSSGAYTLEGLPAGSYKVDAQAVNTAIDATHVRIVSFGYYKSGAAPNFSATLAGATAIAVSP